MAADPLVVSYYTPGTAYEDHARHLARSLDRFGIEHRIEPRAAKASWVENCAQKPLFVRDMQRQSDRAILWIDADAFVVRPLTEFHGLDADFAVLKRDGWSFYGGQIYLGAGDGARDLVERWTHYSKNHPQIWDQVTLGYAWWDAALNGGLRTHWLAGTVSDKLKRNPAGRLIQRLTTPAAILHRQESRRTKRGQEKRGDEFTTSHLPLWWREAAARDAPFACDEARRAELGLTEAAALTR